LGKEQNAIIGLLFRQAIILQARKIGYQKSSLELIVVKLRHQESIVEANANRDIWLRISGFNNLLKAKLVYGIYQPPSLKRQS